ncbi:MAG TPA: MBL fold metallo-hydrolase [Dehalococcoidales bacterium]|nr:MBL fold metallo-hydrolase [Dehalococcoidales bacterium]
MEITWLGHSCFRIKGKQATILTDPFPPQTGYSLGKPIADIVSVSHEHPNHCYVQGISGNTKVISGPGEYEINGVIIQGIQTYHDTEHGAIRGKNTAFLFEVDDITVCHLGDLGHTLNAEQSAKLNPVDILIVPAGGGTTIDAAQAAHLVRALEPKIVIPMHYKTDLFTQTLAPLDGFLKEMAVKEAVPQPKLIVNKNALPPLMQVVVLSYHQS